VGVANFVLGQSIGIDENNTFQVIDKNNKFQLFQ